MCEESRGFHGQRYDLEESARRGQVVNVIREWRATGWSEHGVRTRHISIPASYQAGVTIAALTGSEAHRRLMHASQLPLLYEDAHSPSK
ncbi:unnamed protein product [Plutella xylostella]|uniref:(diamondback moth) hypothetical protein n=1 Tax=Plutella xylostella TaxID=51655 RepID=A0A8S4F6Q6_PLUXY|nr:unnamed protein product [Plutella xylostella]